MSYPKSPNFHDLITKMLSYARYKHEYGSKEVEEKLQEIYSNLYQGFEDLKNLEEDESLNINEPSGYEEILKLRPEGPRRMTDNLPLNYEQKLEGAILSRFAGCILGAPVEFHSLDSMEHWAKYNGQEYPLKEYWKTIKSPGELRYGKSDFTEYTIDGMTKVPVDDDIVYTILNLLLVEEYGNDFTTDDVGKLWEKYLPYACTAEEIALINIKKGVNANEVALIDNPYREWIGADIRSDAFAYMAPGYPEYAAKMAYYDAYISHRRNGIYGEMFFAAAQSAAFVVDNPIEAIKIGLTEIPKDCKLAQDVTWALSQEVKDYKEARRLVDEKFKGMEHAHTNNNACLTVFGLMIGLNDISKVIGETVAMGMDNDCTAATAGSIVGAIAGIDNLESQWYKGFNDTVDTYLNDVGELKISDVLKRFKVQAIKVMNK